MELDTDVNELEGDPELEDPVDPTSEEEDVVLSSCPCPKVM